MKLIGTKKGGKHLNPAPSNKPEMPKPSIPLDENPIEKIFAAESVKKPAPAEKPKVKPAEIPAEKPRQKPVEAPEEKPKQKPVEAPEEKPKQKPVKAPAEKQKPAEAPDILAAVNPERSRERIKQLKKEQKRKKRGKRLVAWLCVIAFLVGAYFFFVYTQFGPVKSLRDAYIETAMSTMNHQWLAELFFPQSVIDEVVDRMNEAKEAQNGINSKWEKTEKTDKTAKKSPKDKFYELFREIDKESFEDYIKHHPNAVKKGWDKIYINEAGIDDKGTSIKTTDGDTVLAVDAKNEIILIRVEGSGFQGVLAIAKDSSRLSCCAASTLGSYGQYLGDIAEKNNGILALNGSGFLDEGGVGSGGQLCGFAMCNGKAYGTHSSYGNKRIELHKDNLMYITDAYTDASPDTTDCVEFSPAIIVDGKVLIDEYSGFSSINPRACIGQNKYGEVMMLVIEGRLVGRSLGCGLVECAKILERYDAYQILNLDGGTSAVMWYKGEYVTKCSNPQIQSRYLPNAWIYK